MVEYLAYNEKVSGSSPLFSKGPFRLVVRTLPFHGNNTGSNPVRDIVSSSSEVERMAVNH